MPSETRRRLCVITSQGSGASRFASAAAPYDIGDENPCAAHRRFAVANGRIKTDAV
jgi:hypothetical protein